jgi:uncharacterized RDD family membrane protein YckC
VEQPEEVPPNGAARVTVPTAARSVQGHRAGIVTRTLAASVDAAVGVTAVALGYAGAVAAYFVLSPRGFSFPDPGFGLLFACFLGFLVCYFTLAWATTGRTYGARLLGLRVVNARGGRVRPLIAFARAWICVFIPVVLFWVIISRENRSAADVLLRTSVIYDWASS